MEQTRLSHPKITILGIFGNLELAPRAHWGLAGDGNRDIRYSWEWARKSWENRWIFSSLLKPTTVVNGAAGTDPSGNPRDPGNVGTPSPPQFHGACQWDKGHRDPGCAYAGIPGCQLRSSGRSRGSRRPENMELNNGSRFHGPPPPPGATGNLQRLLYCKGGN